MSSLIKGAKFKRFVKPSSLPSTYLNGRIIRDNYKRQQMAENEVQTRALKFIARNNALPQRMRLEAQIQLTQMPNATRSTQLKGRCVDTGRARGVLRDFRLCRYQVRQQALQGLLPGVKKGVW